MKSINVLIAEDSVFNQMIIGKILQELKHRHKIVDNGQKAVNETMKKKFDIILMDLEMPVLGGIDATNAIRSDESNPNFETPIIGFTSHININERNKLNDLGMNDFVLKPFVKSDIVEVFEKFLPDNTDLFDNTEYLTNFNRTKDVQYDLSYLKEFTNGDDEFFKKMLSYFIENTTRVMHSFDLAIEKKDWNKIHQIAHKYGSEIAFVGVHSIAEKLNEIEYFDFNSRNNKEMAELVESVKSECLLITKKIKLDYNL